MATPVPAERVERASGPVALVTIDNGEDYRSRRRSAARAFESRRRALDELESGDWAAPSFTGKPFVFCVGADIDEFTRDPLARGRARGHPRRARALRPRSARCPSRPSPRSTAPASAAASSSRCTATRARSRRTSATSASPRCFLSIIPAWGGTQLVPRLVGPEAAAKLDRPEPAAPEQAAGGARGGRARPRRPAARAGRVPRRVARVRAASSSSRAA